MDAGVALFDQFRVGCSGWINCLAVDNDKLRYSFYVAYKDVKADLPLYSGVNTTASLMFPAGDASDDYNNQLTVVISNSANYTATFDIYPVSVRSSTVFLLFIDLIVISLRIYLPTV